MKKEEEKLYTKTEIDHWLEKGHRFLRCVGSFGAIRKLLKGFGYTREEHERGWNLYLGLMGYEEEEKAEVGRPEVAMEAEAASKEWVKVNFPKGKAALKARYPDQGEYLFRGLEGEKKAVFGVVAVYLDRIEKLRQGTEAKRKERREEDQAAVLLLERRRLAGAEEEERLRRWYLEMTGLLEDGEEERGSTKEAEGPASNVLTAEAKEQAQIKAFVLWLEDWKTTAKAEIKRRDYLISLGFATRRKVPREAARSGGTIGGQGV